MPGVFVFPFFAKAGVNIAPPITAANDKAAIDIKPFFNVFIFIS
ncbi:hypothetical protein [uncultured Dubosiella sp.]|nr:hypothetical protein [uncultured Dubosiella sp.]